MPHAGDRASDHVRGHLRNRLVAEWEAAGKPSPGQRAGEGDFIGTRRLLDGTTRPVPMYASVTATSAFDTDLERAALWAGMSVGRVNEVKPAAEIVHETVREAEAILRRLSPAAESAPLQASRAGRRAPRGARG